MMSEKCPEYSRVEYTFNARQTPGDNADILFNYDVYY